MSKSPDAFRTISEVAEWLGIQAHVLRFWESKFTQLKPVKRAGGRRYYRPTDMLLLGGIRHLLHDKGLSIKEVQAILRDQGIAAVSELSHGLDSPIDAAAAAPTPPMPTASGPDATADVAAIDVPHAQQPPVTAPTPACNADLAPDTPVSSPIEDTPTVASVSAGTSSPPSSDTARPPFETVSSPVQPAPEPPAYEAAEPAPTTMLPPGQDVENAPDTGIDAPQAPLGAENPIKMEAPEPGIPETNDILPDHAPDTVPDTEQWVDVPEEPQPVQEDAVQSAFDRATPSPVAPSAEQQADLEFSRAEAEPSNADNVLPLMPDQPVQTAAPQVPAAAAAAPSAVAETAQPAPVEAAQLAPAPEAEPQFQTQNTAAVLDTAMPQHQPVSELAPAPTLDIAAETSPQADPTPATPAVPSETPWADASTANTSEHADTSAPEVPFDGALATPPSEPPVAFETPADPEPAPADAEADPYTPGAIVEPIQDAAPVAAEVVTQNVSPEPIQPDAVSPVQDAYVAPTVTPSFTEDMPSTAVQESRPVAHQSADIVPDAPIAEPTPVLDGLDDAIQETPALAPAPEPEPEPEPEPQISLDLGTPPQVATPTVAAEVPADAPPPIADAETDTPAVDAAHPEVFGETHNNEPSTNTPPEDPIAAAPVHARAIDIVDFDPDSVHHLPKGALLRCAELNEINPQNQTSIQNCLSEMRALVARGQ